MATYRSVTFALMIGAIVLGSQPGQAEDPATNRFLEKKTPIPVTAKPTPQNEVMVEELANQLEQIRRLRTELEAKERATMEMLARKLAEQAERLQKLGLAPTPSTFYFPTRIGTKRVYAVNGGKDEKTDIVRAIERLSNGSLRVRMENPKDLNEQRHILVSHDALEILQESKDESGRVVLKPALGKSVWFPFENEQMFRQSGPEEVLVPAGKFMALRVDYGKGSRADFKPEGTIWYAPGVGTVKHIDGRNETLILKSFTIGH
ncbi:MAG: hypothetical protein ACRCZF_17895 [Gemmataceae bacterium]